MPSALEAAVTALAAAVPASVTAVVCVRFLADAHERHNAAWTAVALEAPLGLASGGGGSGGGGSGDAVCLSWWHAMELLEMQG